MKTPCCMWHWRNSKICTTEYADKIALLKGASSASVGLHQQAQEIFNQLLAKNIAPQVEAKAWYWLAHSAFATDKFDIANTAMTSVQERNLLAHLSAQQQRELVYQQAIVQMYRGDPDWHQRADSLPVEDIYRSYLAYNRAMHAAQAQNYDAAITALQVVENALTLAPETNWWPFSSMQTDTTLESEKQNFLDKVYLAKGQLYLGLKDYQSAQQNFSQIGQDAFNRELAFFNFAQAMENNGESARAMSFWQYLSDNASSYIAYPASFSLALALDELGDKQQAMTRYLHIETRLEQELTSVCALLSSMASEQFFSQLIDNTYAWPAAFMDIHHDFLTGNNAQLLQVYRALVLQESKLQEMDHRARMMLTLLEERHSQRLQRAEMMAHDSLNEKVEALSVRQKELEEVLEGARLLPALLADKTQKKQLERLQRATEKLQLISAHKTLSPDYEKRLMRIKNILDWQLSDRHIPRSWQVKTELQKTQSLIEKAKNQLEHLKTLGQNKGDLDVQVQRVMALRQRIEGQIHSVALARQGQKSILMGELEQSLLARQSLLTQYQYQSKLARIRLQDFPQADQNASVAVEGGPL